MAKTKSAEVAEPAARGARKDRLIGLKILAIVAGGVLMGLEIAGSRLLAPHFGNSVFVWGSLISVFLAALSLGYWAGGLLADRHPTWGLLGGICVGAAALIFLVPVIGHPVSRTLAGLGLDDRSGPFAAALILFLPPSFLLGMVSPFAVRLAARSVETIGRQAGTLYALSTLGSIGGTLVTTFVLIPEFGVMAILRGLGVAMLLLPLVLLLDRRKGAPLVPALIVGALGLIVPAAPAERLLADETLVLAEDTPYHGIQVVDYVDAKIRALKFDRYVESSIFLRPPYATASEYTNYFHLASLVRPRISSAAFIGAGGGIGPRAFHETDPEARIDVVDIDPRVLEIAVEHFHMPEVPQIVPHAADGRMWLKRQAGGFDVIVLDAFTIGGRIPFHLATQEAFELMRDRLAPGGVFVMNTNSALDGPEAEIFRAISATLIRVFPSVQAFAHDWRFDKDLLRSRNVLFVASRDQELPGPAEWLARASRFVPRSMVSRETMMAIAQDMIEVDARADAVVLTDDHAPIETMRF